MCTAIRFNRFEFSDDELQYAGLKISGDEVRVTHNSKNALLPIMYRGRNMLLEWGTKEKNGLPQTGFCKKESLEAGKWAWLNPVEVLILASSAYSNGIWYQVRKGIKGILLKDKESKWHVYVLTETSTHYFKTMTGSDRMPVLDGQLI